MFLVDTNLISEIRKGPRADAGAIEFLSNPDHEIFMPVQVIGELRFGVERLKRKGDLRQAKLLDSWFQSILKEFSPRILVFDADCAQAWGRMKAIREQNPIDKQIAAIALVYDLTIATRNVSDFSDTGVQLLNPFSGISASQPLNS